METGAMEKQASPFLHPYLQALLAAEVPVDQILVEAENLGCPPIQLVGIAEHLITRFTSRFDAVAPICLALGATSTWEPFVAEARRAKLDLLAPLFLSSVYPLEELLGEDRWETFAHDVLRRLGCPSGLSYLPTKEVANPAEVVAWLESGMGLVAHEFELRDFKCSSTTWGDLIVDYLVLRDGVGPQYLSFHTRGVEVGPAIPGYPIPGDSTRLFRVKRLRAVQGLKNAASLVAVDCPDLESLDDTPPVVVLNDCPHLACLPPGTRRSLLLHLERCPRIRSIEAQGSWDGDWCDSIPLPYFGRVVLSECPGIRELPAQMKVERDLLLRRMGPFDRWPTDFQIGGDLRLQDCSCLEELPVIEVSGSVRVTGASGLRRLSPGTVIGKHLDLRACHRLEAIPRGVKVGGRLYLPEHLHWSVRWAKPEPLLEVAVERYPALRTLLMSQRFPELVCLEDRFTIRDRADAILENLQRELCEYPALENELLWTASEAWRDLAEERTEKEEPWCSGYLLPDAPNSELPLAWFRGLLFDLPGWAQ